MDQFTDAFIRDTLACAVLKQYGKHLCHHGTADCATVSAQLKDIANRMLNDGTITQQGFSCLVAKLDEPRPDETKDRLAKLSQEAIKCFMKHMASECISRLQSESAEFKTDLQNVLNVKANCKATQESFSNKYHMEEIVRSIIEKYIPAPMTEMLKNIDYSEFD